MVRDEFRDVTDTGLGWENAADVLLNIRLDPKVLTRAASPLFIISIPTLTKGCELHSRFRTNWLWWCLNYVSSSCKTLPWRADVISPGPAETPPPYFLLPCTLNRSALRNVPRRLCSRACIIWPQNSLFPTSKHYLPCTSANPDKALAICQCRAPQTGCN